MTDVFGSAAKGSGWLGMLDPMPWAEGSPCSQTDPDVFMPLPGYSGVDAKRICWGSCDVRETCLQYALDEDIDEGVWGGATSRDRWKLKRGLPVVLEPPVLQPRSRVGEPKSYDHMCGVCGTEFRGHPHARYCSVECKTTVRAGRYNKARRKNRDAA